MNWVAELLVKCVVLTLSHSNREILERGRLHLSNLSNSQSGHQKNNKMSDATRVPTVGILDSAYPE